MTYSSDLKKLDTLHRGKYNEVVQLLGKKMFSECVVPTVYDFANIEQDESLNKITHISEFTGNTEDILSSIKKREANYTEEESSKFMKSVIAANITDITESGYFYKKLISSCDNMRIIEDDCKSGGEKINLPIDEDFYEYKVKLRYIKELDGYTETFEEFQMKTKDKNSIHVRTFLTCKTDINHRCFCKKCAGVFKRSHDDIFTPEDIGIYSTLMITEHATQASLDSMNKGVSVSLNSLIETKLDKKEFGDYASVKKKINEIVDQIGNIGVQSRYYEIALLSRFYRKNDGSFDPSSLQTSFMKQGDKLGAFIYKPTEKNFIKLLSSKFINADSMKSKIMMDAYD